MKMAVDVGGRKVDELSGFSELAVPSFDFWNNSADEIYQKMEDL
jgi:hypothetical protein